MVSQVLAESTLLDTFLSFHAQLQNYSAGNVITVDGQTLSIPAVVAAARYPWPPSKTDGKEQITLSTNPDVRREVQKSRDVIDAKVKAGKSIYGVTTGVGGSADIRSDDSRSLSLAFVEILNMGVLPTDLYKPSADARILSESLNIMPRDWVRGALLVRSNSLIRGHSGVRWNLIESMVDMLNKNISPVIPVRGSISASGDLSPLSYVLGAMIGKPNILVHCPAPSSSNTMSGKVMPSSEALALHGLKPVILAPKEALGVMNGTSFSASVAALVTFQSIDAVILAEVCTAMGTEALLGTQANYASFISSVRPHPGQIEVSATLHHLLESSSLASSSTSQLQEANISEDVGKFRQDRYALRTAPQWIGPLVEDIMSAVRTTEIECNSTTDNPLVDASTSDVHNGGNFQALALTMAFEKTRLSLFLLGKILFAQATEMLNPAYNNGLPPNLAATDPSINYHSKGLEVAMASYVSELGWLASNVGTHVQSAEMHNQAINSLALISGRATLKALEVLNMLISSYLYLVCHALDLRAMQNHYNASLQGLIAEELSTHLGQHFKDGIVPSALHSQLLSTVLASLGSTSTADAERQFEIVATGMTSPILDFFASSNNAAREHGILHSISALRSSFAKRGAKNMQALRHAFITGKPPSLSAPGYSPTAPAGPFLGRTKPVYEYIRKVLGIRMHGLDHLEKFSTPLGGEPSIGYNVSLIYEAIEDQSLGTIVANVFRNNAVRWPPKDVRAKL